MGGLALVLCVVWGALAFGWRMLIQLRRTGDSGFRGVGARPGSVDWWARVVFVGALAAVVAGPVADVAGWLDPLDALDHGAVAAGGTALALAGIAGTLAAQLAMGDSWRIGVDEAERTALVTGGPFRVVRNPIFSTMLVTAAGIALMVPNVLALAGLAALVLALELQVRAVEEPYLRRTHRDAFAAYEARVGRFVPRLGRSPR